MYGYFCHAWSLFLLYGSRIRHTFFRLGISEVSMRDFLDDRETVLAELSSDAENGLSDGCVEENRKKYGSNALTKPKKESLLKRIWEAATEPMIIMLIAAGFIALAVNIYRAVSGGEADFLECVGIFCAISLSVIISVVMEGRSAKAFEALNDISENIVVKAIRNGKTLLLPQQEIVVGDIICLAVGDKVPADGRLVSSVDLSSDESMLTGESLPARKDALFSCEEKTPLAERANMVYGGTYVTAGSGKAVITAVGDKTEFGKIASELRNNAKTTTPLQQKLARLGKIITILGVTAAAIVFISELISFALHDGLNAEDVMEAFVTSIVLIVAAVPEGLPTIVAVSLSINIIKLARRNALVKKMIASETVGCINIICSDKTGTLTENKMTVRTFFDGTFHEDVSEFDDENLKYNICLNSTADLGENGKFLGNPTECALLNFYEGSKIRKTGDDYRTERKKIKVIKAFPFTSDLKHMTTLIDVGGEIKALTKGSPEYVLSSCFLDEEEKVRIESEIKSCEEKAMRVIAFAHKDGVACLDYEDGDNHRLLESGMTFDGFVAISDPLRKEVYDAVKSCRSAGVSLKILTGDNIFTAQAIANELALLDEGMTAVEAKDLENLTDEELGDRLASICVIARSTPTVKMRVVQILKNQGNVVAVTGDGINDAPALKNADVGIAMGISGTEVSKEAADVVLLDDSFATIVKAVEWGRNIYENFKRFITFQLTVNLSSVIVVFTAILLGLQAPFTALQLLWINIIMDGPPALTLGLEPNYKDLMSRPPTKRNESIISKPMFARIFVTGGLMSAVFLCQYVYNFLNVPEAQQLTVLFTMFVLFQLFNSFNCRELHSESIFRHLLQNKLMLVVVGTTFVLQVLIIQFAGSFFGTVPLPFTLWLKLFGIAACTIVLSEAVKAVIRLINKIRKKSPQTI